MFPTESDNGNIEAMLVFRMEERGYIVVIEDPFIRKLLRDLLTRRGYRIVDSSARQIATLLKENAGHVDLVITNTPGDLLEFAPELPLLYLAAAPDPDLAARFRHCRTVHKPFQAQQLVSAVEELTAAAVA